MSARARADDALVLLVGLLALLGSHLLGQPVGLLDHGAGLGAGLADGAPVLLLRLRRSPLGLLGVVERLADGRLAFLHAAC